MLGKPKLAFNFDGGSPAKLTIGATGGYRMTIDIQGLASHAGNRPERGRQRDRHRVAGHRRPGEERLARPDRERPARRHEQRRRDPRRRGDERRDRPRATSRRSPQPRSEVPRADREGNRSRVRAGGRRRAQHGRQVRHACDSTAGSITNRFGSRATSRASSAAAAAIEAEGLRAGTRRSRTAASTPTGSPPTAFPPSRSAAASGTSTRREELDIAEFHTGPPHRTSPSHGGGFSVV